MPPVQNMPYNFPGITNDLTDLANQITLANQAIATAFNTNMQIMARVAAAFYVEPTSPASMQLSVLAGSLNVSGTIVEVATQLTPAIAAPVTNGRMDLVVVDTSSGVASVITGTEATTPAPPAIPSGKLPLAWVTLVPKQKTIAATNLTDKRTFFSTAGTATTPPPPPPPPPPPTTAWYVSPSGSDSNNGTSNTTPFLTLEKAQAAAQGSSSVKTIYLMAGTYHRTAAINLSTSDNGETWTYQPSDGVNNAILDGGGSTYSAFEVFGSNITFNGIKMQNYTNYELHKDGGATVTGIIVENCDLGSLTATGTWNSGAIEFENINGVTIKNNYVHDTPSQGIALFAYASGSVLDNVSITGNCCLRNVQAQTDGGAIYCSDHNGYKSSGNTSITNNYCKDYGNSGSARACGIYLDDSASYWTITGNVIGPPNPAWVNGSQSCYGIEENNGSYNVVKNNIIDLGTTSEVYAVVWYYGDNPVTSLTGPNQTGEIFEQNLVISNFAGNNSPPEFGGGDVLFYQNSGSASDYTISNNDYYNYGGGQHISNGAVKSDSSPLNINPLFSTADYTYTISASSSVLSAPLNFTPIVGGWGPPGFTLPQTGTKPSYHP
jgi:hypothetical protein